MERLIDKGELISIIVPVYNVKHYLRHCLDTIAMQSYQNLEIILIDDGSTDGSGEICDSFSKFDNRCVVIHQSNQGLWAARNSGQRVAKGDYIMFVDSDDYLHIDMVKYLYNALVQNPQCSFSMCNYKSTESLDEDTLVICNPSSRILSTEQVFSIGDEGLVYVVWNKLYRRSLIEGLYARNFRIAQDVDYNSRVYLYTEYAAFVDCELYFWMQRSNSATHKEDYWYSFLMTITDIYYLNYNEILDKNKLVSGHLLQSLYWRLLSLRAFVWRTDKEKVVTKKCRCVIKETWYDFLSYQRVSFIKRLYVFVLLCVPSGIPHWLMLMRRKLKKSITNFKNRGI